MLIPAIQYDNVVLFCNKHFIAEGDLQFPFIDEKNLDRLPVGVGDDITVVAFKNTKVLQIVQGILCKLGRLQKIDFGNIQMDAVFEWIRTTTELGFLFMITYNRIAIKKWSEKPQFSSQIGRIGKGIAALHPDYPA